jgi:hypothetical protein
MHDLVAWLRAAMDEDEQVAQGAAERDSGEWFEGDGWNVYRAEDTTPHDDEDSHDLVVYGNVEVQSAHIARHDPARVLREVAAKRGIVDARDALVRQVADNAAKFVELMKAPAEAPQDLANVKTHGWTLGGRLDALDVALRHLATVYADREGYRDDWRP